MKVISFLLLFFCNTALFAQVDANRVLVNTTVVDFKQKPRVGEKITFTNTKTGKGISKISDKDGKCFFVLLKGNEYAITYKNYGKSVEYSKINIPQIERLKELKVVVKFQPARIYTLDNVLFATGKAELKGNSHQAIDDLVEAMKAKPTMTIEIAGHTDNVGDKTANMILSQNRAEAVRNYLISKGIHASRIVAKGYGDTQPIASRSVNISHKTQIARLSSHKIWHMPPNIWIFSKAIK